MKSKNAWIEHIKATKKKHPNLPLKEIIKLAKKSYKKKKKDEE